MHIGDDGALCDATLAQMVADGDDEKNYRVQVIESEAGDFRTWTRWDRPGRHFAGRALGDGSLEAAIATFKKKFKEKAGVSWSDRSNSPKGSRQEGYYTFVDGATLTSDSDSNDGFEDPSVASDKP